MFKKILAFLSSFILLISCVSCFSKSVDEQFVDDFAAYAERRWDILDEFEKKGDFSDNSLKKLFNKFSKEFNNLKQYEDVSFKNNDTKILFDYCIDILSDEFSFLLGMDDKNMNSIVRKMDIAVLYAYNMLDLKIDRKHKKYLNEILDNSEEINLLYDIESEITNLLYNSNPTIKTGLFGDDYDLVIEIENNTGWDLYHYDFGKLSLINKNNPDDVIFLTPYEDDENYEYDGIWSNGEILTLYALDFEKNNILNYTFNPDFYAFTFDLEQ